MIYTALYIMLLMRANTLQGQVGGGGALEIETFLGSMKWHRAVRRVPFEAQKVKFCPLQKHYVQGRNQRSTGSFMYMSSNW